MSEPEVPHFTPDRSGAGDVILTGADLTIADVEAVARGTVPVRLDVHARARMQEARDVIDQIEKASGRKVEATQRVDPDLIGGLVLQVGSLRLDASVRGRLDRLRQELTPRR